MDNNACTSRQERRATQLRVNHLSSALRHLTLHDLITSTAQAAATATRSRETRALALTIVSELIRSD